MASGYAIFVDVRPSYSVLYAQTNGSERRLVYEHYVSETGEKIDHMNLIKTQVQAEISTPLSQGHENTLFKLLLAACIISFIGILIFVYLKQQTSQKELNYIKKLGYLL